MNISNKAELDAAIIALEKRKIAQANDLAMQFKEVRESLSPVNMIKHSFKKLTETPDMKEGILKTVAGLGLGVLSKRLFLGSSHSVVKKLLSGVFELAVAKTTISNTDKIKAYGISIYNNLFRKNHAPKSSRNAKS